MKLPTSIKALPWRHIQTGLSCPGLWLGLNKDWEIPERMTGEELDEKASSLLKRAITPLDAAIIRVSWKALVDPYYSHVSKKYRNWLDLEEAGLFDDLLHPVVWRERFNDLKDWYTPIPSSYDSLKFRAMVKDTHQNWKPVVLIMPASLSPCHQGHIDALLAAKARAKQEGWLVLGTYLSPSHDNYVSTKALGCNEWPALKRIEYARDKVSNTSILVDPWESIGVPVALNYTDVMDRMGKVYTQIFGFEVTPVLVAGTDNSGFARAFEKIGHGIFVQRGTNPPPMETHRVLVVREAVSDLASRNIRDNIKITVHGKYEGHLLRDDGIHAVSLWTKLHDEYETKYAWNNFMRDLKQALRETTPVSPLWKLKTTSLQDQQKIFDALEPTGHFGILDPCLRGKESILIRGSRVFQMSGDQKNHLYHTYHEPYPIEVCVDSLIDDDSVTGGTFYEAKKLPCVSPEPDLYTLKSIQGFDNSYDPIDARDFLIGSADGGLVVQLHNGKIGRVPYWFPFVNLHKRASILTDRQMEFTRMIIDANAGFYSELHVLVSEVDKLTREFLLSMGFLDTDDMLHVCDCLISEI